MPAESPDSMQALPFQGLSEKELNQVYKVATMKRLNPGDMLIREGDTGQVVYVLLEGELNVLKRLLDTDEIIAVLRPGEWVGEIAFTKQTPRTASVTARTPAKVLALSKAALNALDFKIQLYIIRKLNDLANERVERLEQIRLKLTGRNQQLIGYIHRSRSRSRTDYSQSNIIKGIITKIPRLPAFSSSVVLTLLNEESSAKDVAEQVKDDPGLAATVLKTVNSPYYGFTSQISDIHHAVLLLGFNEVYQLVMADGIRRTMPDTKFYRSLQARSLAVSNIAFAVSQATNIGRPAEMATLGLLHDLGRGVVQLLLEKNPNLSILIDTLDDAQLGALLLEEWHLPESFCSSVEFQNQPEFSPPEMLPDEVRANVAILFVSRLAYQVLRGRRQRELPATFLDDYLALLGWPERDMEQALQIRILPELAKKTAYPAMFRQLLEQYRAGLKNDA